MINYIIGEKGFGKTKAMIDLANTEVEKAKGDIVFLTDKNKNIHAVSNKVRRKWNERRYINGRYDAWIHLWSTICKL